MPDIQGPDIIEGRREFEDPVSGKIYYISPPNADDIRSADWQYSKVYTKSLVEGITTAAEMMDILLRRGITGPEFDQRQRELTDEISAKVALLQSATDMDEKQRLAEEVASLRGELFDWNQRLNGPMANTCEQIADDARLEYLTACMVQDADGKRIWEEYSDFLKEKNQSLAVRARFEVMLYLQGLDSDFWEQTPEAQAIKEIEETIQAQAQEALDKLDAEMKKSKEDDKTIVKKKKPRKKKSE